MCTVIFLWYLSCGLVSRRMGRYVLWVRLGEVILIPYRIFIMVNTYIKGNIDKKTHIWYAVYILIFKPIPSDADIIKLSIFKTYKIHVQYIILIWLDLNPQNRNYPTSQLILKCVNVQEQHKQIVPKRNKIYSISMHTILFLVFLDLLCCGS